MRTQFLGVLLALILPSMAWAQGVASKLGEDYQKAAPIDKLVMIAVARQDKVLNMQDSQKEIDEIALVEVNKGKSSEEKLKILGTLRKGTEEKLKAKTEERKAAGSKMPYISNIEPDTYLQVAIADSYVIDKAGPKASLQALECLSVVRENTTWGGHGALTLALVMEALDRDEAYLKADHEGKLKIVKNLTEDKQMLSSQEQTTIEKAIISDWMNGLIKAGKSPKDVKDEVEKLYKRKALCFFTWSWSQSILERMSKVR